MPWGLVAMLLMPLGLDRVPLELMGLGVGWVNEIARAVAAWPGAQVHVPPMSAVALAVGSFGLAFVCLWQGRTRLWGAGRLVLRPGRGGNFIREVWTDRYGASATTWNVSPGLRCDADGCILTRGSRRVLIAFTPTALAEDCAKVDAAISFVPGRAFCRATPVHDVFDLRRHGALALRMTERGVTVRSVDDAVGDRRWWPKPKPRVAQAQPEAETVPDARTGRMGPHGFHALRPEEGRCGYASVRPQSGTRPRRPEA